jgi:hypothetical protein
MVNRPRAAPAASSVGVMIAGPRIPWPEADAIRNVATFPGCMGEVTSPKHTSE